MPSLKGLNPDALAEQAKTLQQLIDDARSLQKEITDHLKKLRQENRSTVQPIGERRKGSR
jgi:hypothetical protein